MTSMRNRAANELLRQRVLRAFDHHKYEILDASAEEQGLCTVTGRKRGSEVVLETRLRKALSDLNPGQPEELINKAVEQLTLNLSIRADAVTANREIYHLLKDGVKLDVMKAEGEAPTDEKVTINVIDWKNPTNNDFLLVTNFWVNGAIGRGRLEYVGFVNGLPWLLPVLHIAEQQKDLLQTLYDVEVNNYKRRFPQLFWYNALILLSDGRKSKVGSMTAPWEHFVEWKRVESEDEPEDTSLETLLRGTSTKERLVDIVENFTLFSKERGGLSKIVARYHQYIGVNAAFARMSRFKELKGQIGVFWHTQGAGKSYSMAFFVQKVQRRLPGTWTFVIVTDRKDLDEQIYQNFARPKIVTEKAEQVRAGDSKELKRLLGQENHRIVFTLIQKFRPEKAGQKYEELSQRDDIIVMTDEAHRSEYDTLAENMRTGLPYASFIGFTGTPLIEDEEHETRTTFGPYISKYPFFQATKDGVTVDLIYENRTPEIEIHVPEVAQRLQQLESGLSDEEKQKLRERIFQKDTVIKSGPRLDFVARDIVQHYMNRGYMGKAMVVSMDKITTVRTYNRVYEEWKKYQNELELQLQVEYEPERWRELERAIQYMKDTEMAVVLSISEKEDKDHFKQFNKEHPEEQIEIKTHYERSKSDLEECFKNSNNSLRIVFVCSMWMTGFDVPCLSTLYLDHPMEKHTLMQAIARPNRVFDKEKICGQIVDYVAIYNKLLKALNIYAQPGQGISAEDLDIPLKDKSQLINDLDQALTKLEIFCQQNGVDVSGALTILDSASGKVERDTQIQIAANELVKREEVKLDYLTMAWEVYRFYQALLPDKEASRFKSKIFFFRQIQLLIFAAMNCRDVNDIVVKGQKIVAESLSIYEYDDIRLRDDPGAIRGKFNLSEIDLVELAACMKAGYSYLQTERLHSLLDTKLEQMTRVNPRRIDFRNRLMEMKRKYNEGSANIADYPDEIVTFAREVLDEDSRHIREQVSEEELAIVDLLTLPQLQLNDSDKQRLKEIARMLLRDLRMSGKMALEWYKKPDLDSGVWTVIRNVLDDMLPASYTPPMYRQMCEETYGYIRLHFEDGEGPKGA